MADPVYATATHPVGNALAALLLGIYLAIVFWNGNLGTLSQQAESDFLGAPGKPAFWKWAVALLVLYALAANPSTNHLFGPLLVIVIVAMLVENSALFSKAAGTIQSILKQ